MTPRGPVALATILGVVLGSCGGISPDDFGWVDGSGRRMVAHGPMRLQWEARLTVPGDGPYIPMERAAPALDPTRGRIYMGSTAGVLLALSPQGRTLGRFRAHGGIESEPALDGDADELYFGTEQGMVYKLRASDLSSLWSDQVGGAVRLKPLLLEDAVYVVTSADSVVAMARSNGDTLWTYHRALPETYAITEHAGIVQAGGHLITAFTDGTVVALSPGTGDVAWERATSVDAPTSSDGRSRFVDVDTTPVVVGDTLFVASFAAGLYQLSAASGTVLWHGPEYRGVIAMAHARGRLYLASVDQGLICLSANRRRLLWRRPFDRGAPTTPVVAHSLVLVGESRGSFLALSARTGEELGRLEAGHGFSAKAAAASHLGFVLSNAGTLFSFSL